MGPVARMPTIAARAERLLGSAVVATTPVAGGDICTATKIRLGSGRNALVKTRPGVPDGFFPAEARGLRRLAAAGAEVPEVLAVEADCLIIDWVEPSRPTPELAAQFGRDLARLHTHAVAQYGEEADGFIGFLPLPNRSCDTWAEFYTYRRVLPYLKLARDRGHISPEDAAVVEAAAERRADLFGPEEGPVQVHGDLWSGNVVWNADRGGVLIDPAAYGGNGEVDLAMLALFGLPHYGRMLAAYDETRPLPDGWQDRQPLHQLFPLLVHACLFGGRYGPQAAEAARKLV